MKSTIGKSVLLLLSVLLSLELCPSGFAATRQPNIIILLADDLGYADIGANGCNDIPTPHIDSIAKNGVRFTDGYATHSVCSPSRAGLMSGMYQHRYGFEHNSGPERFTAPNFGLPKSVPTLAEKLKAAGYSTGMVGKWHIGFSEGLRPHERGFDYHFGFLSGARTYIPGKRDIDPLIRNGKPVTDEKEYLTDAFAREATDFMERSKGKPYFLYLAFNAVHLPLESKAEKDIRFSSITNADRKTYAGMLSSMDDAIGRVLGKVREQGQEEHTLIFFYADNGGPTPQTTSRNDPLRGFKAQFFEGGIRVPFLAQWKGTIPAGLVYREMVMGFDCHTTALAAANVSRPNDKPLDGVNLVPFLTGKQTGKPHEQLFWRTGPQHAVRSGDWKLVNVRGDALMLFNLKDDIGEKNDLATTNPEKLKELQKQFDEWAKGMMTPQWVRQDSSNAEPGGKKKADAPAQAAPKAGARLQEVFKTSDKNNDGKLSESEYPQPNLFKTIDKDNDGFATIDEIRAYYASRRDNPAPTKKQ